MVFGCEEFWLCKTIGWNCGINYGKKTSNVVELKYRQQRLYHFHDSGCFSIALFSILILIYQYFCQ